ncbi:MAG: hypothetical protein KGI03_00820 [Patescibacteria group bacterium]|nr:hypothetical protein [Patescibacteria group bacterium]
MRLSDSLKQLGRPVVFYPKLAEVFGIHESIFISHFVYWSDKGIDPEGWIYKSAEEIEQETGLSYEQQRRVRKALSGSRIGAKGRKVARPLLEPVLMERYDRTDHRMFFRIDFEALDRVFSQGSLFPLLEGHMDNVQVPPGLSPTGTRTLSKSSISKSTTKSTSKNKRSAHKDFVKFFDETSVKVRGKKPSYDDAGFRNLKLALNTTDESTLERLCLYYLADAKFSAYALDLKTFLSGGVMKALADQERKDGFVKKLDGYVDRYLRRTNESREYRSADLRAIIGSLAEKFSA